MFNIFIFRINLNLFVTGRKEEKAKGKYRCRTIRDVSNIKEPKPILYTSNVNYFHFIFSSEAFHQKALFANLIN